MSRISSIVRAFGAPVTDPQGNRARKISVSPASGRSRAVTSEVSWCTVSKRSALQQPRHRDAARTATRARSLRTRSTIMTFSARSFGLDRSRATIRSSSATVRPRAAVPFIGRMRIRSPR